ncbi:glycosyltransferase family 2 protein [Pelagibius litoralis]|uniref:Glycosyltransferase family 2 protein n=1 Tax=Pelagibius litoralis TaxID=374515 RepID=A0A967C5B9_9PROT|nr:glycosyltransferase family 2 protein [Pelagibius litoralis]NIA69024.1 glycosyltransferase family 2 protein [Pelagibius litoralis]
MSEKPAGFAPGTRPLVSVITAAFNAEAFIAETIASVQRQSLTDWEMLVADDASSDSTAAIVQAAAEKDLRIKLLRLTENGGVGRARNAALEQAQGRFIAFLDSDDLWLQEKLERQVAFMKQWDCAVSYTAFRRINEDGRQLGRLFSIPDSLTYAQLLKNTAIATLTGMVDTQKTGPIRMTEVRRDDFILWLSILKRGFLARGLQQDLARYRVVKGSLSSKPKRSAAWTWSVYRGVEKLNLIHAAWCMAHYGARAVLKRLVF